MAPRRSSSHSKWDQHARETLRSEGHRSGGARMAVVELLGRQHCCLTAQEIFDALREHGKGPGIASIYRTLDLLTRTGLVRRVELGPAACYEPAHPGGEHHHHVVCERCGKVASFEDPELEEAITRLARRLRYSVGEHDVVLRGSCPDCS